MCTCRCHCTCGRLSYEEVEAKMREDKRREEIKAAIEEQEREYDEERRRNAQKAR